MQEQSPAGWYTDPSGRHEHRHWDGTRWTEHVVSQGRQTVDPLGEATPVPTVAIQQTLAGWYPDPTGRHEHRYWDGSRWTEQVGSQGRQRLDPAIEQTSVPTAGKVNKKTLRQVRKAGAGDGPVGGGTLFTEQVLVINQKAKLFGSTLEYAVYSQHGQQLGKVQELRRNLMTTYREKTGLRGGLASTRSHRFQVVDMTGRVLLALTRPKMGLFSMKAKLVIEGPEGDTIGRIAQESFGVGGSAATLAHTGLTDVSAVVALGAVPVVGPMAAPVVGAFAKAALGPVQKRLTPAVSGLDKIGHARFGLEAGGQRVGFIHAESAAKWDFVVRDPAGAEIARITKTWAGWAKERFTKADNYVVQMHRPLEEPLRSLVIAAALAIDVELKQRDDQTTGSSVLGTRRYK